ncbi:SMI1/KNR4 family protein [Deinococcus enclensis]|uniref:Knr4/Smi1-like domain-containing protein n=1 Tax=Deinococcus enclensis TaxID=1049582 RepID=A0ABT9MFX0_9DEIO|nr:SMI1/KNR4 family protein [Deinococcus enclensis]MDP9765473.1 hypothetical protein [Deinococcus enclensis]
MTHVTITDSEPPLQPEDLAAFQAEHGIPVPAVYAAFLLAHNSGTPTPENFQVRMPPRPHAHRDDTALFETAVDYFLSLAAEGVSVRSAWHYVLERRLQPGMFPVASCGGDLVCLSTRPDSLDQVFYWLSDEEEDGAATSDRNLYPVAVSFGAFLDALT